MADPRFSRRRRDRLLATALAILMAGSSFAPAAVAQERRPRSIMDMLFGSPRSRPAPQTFEAPEPRRVLRRAPRNKSVSRPAPKRNSARNASAAAAGAAGGAAAVALAPVEKSETARTVLVIGDFLAQSLAKGLETAVDQNREIRIVGRTDGSSGLVRDDHRDWPATIGSMLEETKPALVVVMLGANDRQGIRQPDGALTLRGSEWVDAYTARAKALAEAVRSRDIPLVWVGMPAFQSDRATEDMVFFNDLFRNVATAAGGEYIDIWGGFTNADGSFVTSGPDTAGQTVRLRNSDGITLTTAGQEKLAYFVEKPVVKILGLDVGDFVASLGSQQLSATDLPTAVDAALATSAPPVSFADPSLDGGDQLLGGEAVVSAAGQGSPRQKLVEGGTLAQTVEGRADQFNWTGRDTAVSPVTHDNAIVFRGTTSLDELRLQAPGGESPATQQPAAPSGPVTQTPPTSAVN